MSDVEKHIHELFVAIAADDKEKALTKLVPVVAQILVDFNRMADAFEKIANSQALR